MNRKMTSKKLASTASSIMRSQNSSKIQKSLAGSALSQRNSNNVTGYENLCITSLMQSKKL